MLFFLAACTSAPDTSKDASPAYTIDFVAAPPQIERLGDQKAIVTGNVLQSSNLKPTDLTYTITIDLSGGPVQNDTIQFPPLAGRGPTRFASNIEPQIVTDGGTDALSIRLLGTTGTAENPQEGLGVTYYRDLSSQALVTLTLGELIELTNVRYTLTGIDSALTGIDCETAEPNNYACSGAFIDRVIMMSGSGGYTYEAVDLEQVAILCDIVTARYTDTNNNGRPDFAEDRRLSAEEDSGNVSIFHPDTVGTKLMFRFDDSAKGLEDDPDGYHDFDAPDVGIGLASGITFDIVELPPPEPATPDPNLTTISGIVFGDVNRNGIQDSGETGLDADEMRLFEISDGNPRQVMTATVGIDNQHPGTYFLDGVTADKMYRLEVRLPSEPTHEGEPLNPLRMVQTITPTVAGPNQIDFAAWPYKLDTVDENELLLPDLEPLTHYPVPPDMSEEGRADLARSFPSMEQWYLDTESQPGRVLLRFGTLAANIGTGPLHVVGGQATATSRPVYQRLYTPSGGYVEHLVNDFVFHGGHEHVHVEAFEQYNLRDFDTNRIVVSSPKVSFCLTDVLWAVEPDLPQTAPIATVPMGWTCGPVEQSINVGFSDYYGPGLPDQWVDVTEVPSGHYLLEVIVDPENKLKESNEANNQVQIEIDFVNPLR